MPFWKLKGLGTTLSAALVFVDQTTKDERNDGKPIQKLYKQLRNIEIIEDISFYTPEW